MTRETSLKSFSATSCLRQSPPGLGNVRIDNPLVTTQSEDNPDRDAHCVDERHGYGKAVVQAVGLASAIQVHARRQEADFAPIPGLEALTVKG